MGVAAKPHPAVLFLMLLALSVSLGLSAEDVFDAVYDESEAVPFEVISLASILVSPLSARTTQAVSNSLHPKLGVRSRLCSARVRGTDAHRSAERRNRSVLVCVFLCILLC